MDAAKATYDVADATKCKAYLPLLDASGKTLDELSTNWDRIATDGDNVRRYLGTVGVTSPLFKIRGGLKGVLKANDLTGRLRRRRLCGNQPVPERPILH